MTNNTPLTPQDLMACAGQEFGVSDWITIDQARINAFADCTDDHQWIHVDPERAARESPFGTTIAHGYLTLSLLSPTAEQLFMSRMKLKQAINYGLDKVRFLAPVPAGSRVRNRLSIVSVEDKGEGRYLMTASHTIEIEGHDKPALIARGLALLMT